MSSLDIENACSTSRNESIGTTSLEAASCNLSSLDRAVNSSDSTWTSRTGIVRDTIQGALNKLGVLYDDPIRDWTPSLVVSDLRAHRYPASTGDIYIPVAPLPFTTGASFNTDNWVLLSGITSQDLINDLSQAYEFATVAEYKSSMITFPVSKAIYLKDRDAFFSVIIGTGTGNDANLIASDQVNQTLNIIDKQITTLRSLGVFGDSSDETTLLDLAIQYVNNTDEVSEIHATSGKTYKYNGAGMRLESNKTFDGNNADFITDTGVLCILTQGSYSNHRENILIKNVRTTGFADPLMLLFADNSEISNCHALTPSNIGIQVKGDDLIGNLIKENTVDSPGFHCYANNDSVNFDPAHTEQGLRYPRQTTFLNNNAFNANQMAYDAHSSSDQGFTRVIGGLVKNCDQLGKNSFGSMLWENIHWINDSGSGSSTWVSQIGSTSDSSLADTSMCIVKGCTFETNASDLLFLFTGNGEFINNTITTRGTANPIFFQLNNSSQPDRIIKINNNTFNGIPISVGSNHWLNDNMSNQEVSMFEFKNNEILNEISFDTTNRRMFNFAGSTYRNLTIEDNNIDISNSSLVANIAYLTGTTCETLTIKDNTLTRNAKAFTLDNAADIEYLYRSGNINLSQINSYYSQIKEAYVNDNSLSNTIPISTGSTQPTADVIISDFSSGGEYELDISTDLSSDAGTFDTRVKYGILVSRNGVSLTSSTLSSIGTESNINAQFAINGTSIEMWTNTATTHYTRVTKTGERS